MSRVSAATGPRRRSRSKIDHLGIPVDDIEANRELFERLGLGIGAIEYVPAFGVDIAFISIGETLVELVERSGAVEVPLADGT